ncbi:UNVERIFIED_CONTAM: hypothetical protein HDU68_007519 [Siphonaria sp. JEL0065]|nr:hypothetical protein HDU68_007519 [Siphonaria sp. JEL0065]
MQAVPSYSLLIQKNSSVSLNLENFGCPLPKPALIGVLSVLQQNNTARRNYLRQKYTEMNTNLLPSEQIDVKFIFGRPSSKEEVIQLNLEREINPNDTIITNRLEGVNNGKSVDWFRIARNLVYVPHPNQEGRWCRKYLAVAKTDDDTVISVPRASKLFLSLRKDAPLFLGHPFIDTTPENETIDG